MKKIFPEEPSFEVGSVGFSGFDLLERRGLGVKLTELVDRVNQPMVIALDGKWGTGKSHFLKMWAGAHSIELNGKAKIIYFDAFQYDFLDDPLVSLVGSILKKPDSFGWNETTLEKLKSSALKIVKPALKIAVAVATAGVSEVVNGIADEAVKATGDEVANAIGDFWKNETSRMLAMEQFRNALEELTVEVQGDVQKIVFIVDELDRCRPDYSLSLLETVKHFFTVPNVHFVLGANIDILEKSVEARYGSGIDAEKYLQKFITITARLPSVKNTTAASIYLRAVAKDYGLPENAFNELNRFFELKGVQEKVSIRDVQRMIARIAVCPEDFGDWGGGYRTWVFAAIILETCSRETYKRFRNSSLSLEDAAKWFGIMQPQNDSRGMPPYLWALLDCYLSVTPAAGSVTRVETLIDQGNPQRIKGELNGLLADCLDTFTISKSRT